MKTMCLGTSGAATVIRIVPRASEEERHAVGSAARVCLMPRSDGNNRLGYRLSARMR
jgi:hypothetical protein